MNSTFFIGDNLIVNKSGMVNTTYTFVGAKKIDETNKWQINLVSSFMSGYAGGSTNVTWEIEINNELRVSGSMRGYVTIEGLNSNKIKEKRIKALIFKEIECDRVVIEFIM
jgi:hypothetical protein